MTELPPEDDNDLQKGDEPAEASGMDPEFAILTAKPFPLDKDMVDRALEAGVRAQADPENLLNRPLLDPDNLGQLSKAFAALAAGERAGDAVTAVEYDTATKQLRIVSDADSETLPPIPLLEAVANQETIEGKTREDTYPNVRLAFALTAYALEVLDQEKQHLSDKALSVIQINLQKIRELTVHYPLASMAEGLNKGQIAGLLNAINITITSDPVKAAVWEDRKPLQKALERVAQ